MLPSLLLLSLFCAGSLGLRIFYEPTPLTAEENQLLQESCGQLPRIHKRYVNGSTATKMVAPWGVSISHKVNISFVGCSGTLISDRHVVTALHCLIDTSVPQKYLVGYTEECTKQPNNAQNCIALQFNVSASHVFYPASYSGYHHLDIAVVQLRHSVDNVNERILPACLGGDQLHIGDELQYFGYGGKLRKNLGSFQTASASVIDCADERGGPNTTDLICVKQFNSTGIEGGDSGSGWISKSETGRNKIAAITSQSEKVGLLVNVAPHLDWICHYTGICIENRSSVPSLNPTIMTNVARKDGSFAWKKA